MPEILEVPLPRLGEISYVGSVARLIRLKLLTDAEMSGHSVPKDQLPCIDSSSGDDSQMAGK
jgi:hypothetical protein